MKSIDNTKYRKYFACRRVKVRSLIKKQENNLNASERNLMTDLGEKAMETAKKNGMWDNSPSASINDEQITSFAEKLVGHLLAYDNFMKMSRSAKVAYVRRYVSSKNEETRQRDFEKIVDMLNKNLKPSLNGNA